MKKTIAILLVLVLAGAGLFAETTTFTAGSVDGLSPSTAAANINLTTTVANQVLFGLSVAGSNIDSTAKDSFTIFSQKAKSIINITDTTLEQFRSAKEIGRLSGLSNLSTAVTLYLSTPGFETADVTTPIIPLTLSIDTATIPAATAGILGFLDSAVIEAHVTTSTQIDLAPAATYTATVKISIVNPA